MVSGAAGGAASDRGRAPHQQCHAHTDRDRGGGTAQRETAPGRPAHGAANRSGFSMKRRVSTASPPESKAAASLPASPSGWPNSSGCEHQHRPVPQIPRVGHPADRPHRRQRQDAAASLRRCGTAGADHQRRAQHGQQRGGTRIRRAPAQLGAGQQDHAQPGPSHDRGGSWRSRRHWPAVRATRPPTANCQARVGSEKNATAGAT